MNYNHRFVANMEKTHIHVRYMLSVIFNVRAPYSGDWNFQQCFYGIWYRYLSHPL